MKNRWGLLRILMHAGALVPLALLILAAGAGRLSVNPIQDITRRTGIAALVLLLATLACTPASSLFAFRQAIRLRRPLGLYAFFYAALHLTIFVAIDYGFDFNLIWLDVGEKPYIYAGASAFLILLALAFTSFDTWKKRLGKTWKRLHRLVYLAAPLAALHYAWVKKADLLRLSGEIGGPLIAITALLLLLVVRIPPVRRRVARWSAQVRR